MSRSKPIYVEIEIASSIDELWRLTQNPELHERWDARFTRIQYLPKLHPGEVQKFEYSTRIMGVTVVGRGETAGERSNDSGARSSSLRFWSPDPKSLIREGSGYWKYLPKARAIRFLTLYDYKVRYGWAGNAIDRFFFRPAIGWGTAWSFDRLRIWAERGTQPEQSLRAAWIYAIARGAVAFVWLWHGLVPKLWFRHPLESAMLTAGGWPGSEWAIPIIGFGEVALGTVILAFWRTAWPLHLTWLVMLAALAGVALSSPELIEAPFNPVTLNLLVAAVSAIALVVRKDVPTASRCLRQRKDRD